MGLGWDDFLSVFFKVNFALHGKGKIDLFLFPKRKVATPTNKQPQPRFGLLLLG